MRYRIKSAAAQLFAYFILFALIGSGLFQIPFLYDSGIAVPYIDGLFTTVSALCVTGLSTVDMSVYSGAGLAVLLVFIELGGLGLVSFFTIYLAFPAKKVSLVNRSFIREYFIGDANTGIRQIIFRIVIITLLIQLLGASVLSVLLQRAGEKHFISYGIFLSVSAFCNAGFAPYTDSMRRFYSNNGICFSICALIIAGGLGFTVYSDIASRIKRKFSLHHAPAFSLHTKIVLFMTVLLTLCGTILFWICEYKNAFASMTTGESFCNAFFQSVTLRTAGFETVPQALFTPRSMIVSLVLMMIGGSPGSMAGGLKTTTIFLLWVSVFHSEEDRGNLSIFKRDISQNILSKAVGIIVKAFCLLVVLMILLTITESKSLASGAFSLGDLLFETVSAFGTVGLSRGATPLLSSAGKILIMFTMLAGRTGLVALQLGLQPKQSQKNVTDYPCEDVLVG